MAFLIALGTFLFVTTAVLLLGPSERDHQAVIVERLRRLRQRVPSEFEVEVSKGLVERVVRPALQRLARRVALSTPQAAKDRARNRLLMAGSPWGMSANEFLALRVVLSVVMPLGIFGLWMSHGFLRATAVAVLGFAIGHILPDVFLQRRIAERQKAITKALPDVLDLLTVSVEAGLGFDAAVAKVVEKTRGPLGEEFTRLLQEVRMGKPRREAMRDLGERSGVDDLRSFAVAIVQADQLGVGIGRVLRVQAQEMRRKRRQRAEEAAMKAPVKMLFPLIFFIFPALFIVILGPALLQILKLFAGGGL